MRRILRRGIWGVKQIFRERETKREVCRRIAASAYCLVYVNGDGVCLGECSTEMQDVQERVVRELTIAGGRVFLGVGERWGNPSSQRGEK